MSIRKGNIGLEAAGAKHYQEGHHIIGTECVHNTDQEVDHKSIL